MYKTNNFRRFLSLALAVCLSLCFCITASAASNETTTTTYSSDIYNGYYMIKAVSSGKYVRIANDSTESNAELQIWSNPKELTASYIFYVKPIGDYYTITSYLSQKAVEVRNSSKDNFTPIIQRDYEALASQLWQILRNGDTNVSIVNKNSGKMMDVYNNNSDNGTPLIQYERNGTIAQKFELVPVSTTSISNLNLSNLSNTNTSASWNINNSSIKSEYLPAEDYQNLTSYFGNQKNGLIRVPKTGLTYLVQINYINSANVLDYIFEIIDSEDYSTSDLKSLISVARQGRNKGTYNPLVIKKYITFYEASNYEDPYDTNVYIMARTNYKFQIWNQENGVKSPSGSSGTWTYSFDDYGIY